jgi:D-alanyl-D-alanine endopeptidase (penicillin-binding protein 7)
MKSFLLALSVAVLPTVINANDVLVHASKSVEVAPQWAVMSQSVPELNSFAVLVKHAQTGEVLYKKNAQYKAPIASITKLMTAMVVLDAELPLDEPITITTAEIDTIKRTGSRLSIGTTLTRRELLLLALMSSENRAAAALARSYPGGTSAFVARMNRKAQTIGMKNAIFYEGTGLDVRNQATAEDLSSLVTAALRYPLIRSFSTQSEHWIIGQEKALQYKNSNAIVRNQEFQINLSKTGYINEAGRCLVMGATINNQPVIIVLLAANNSNSRLQDARALRRWLDPSADTAVFAVEKDLPEG